MTMPRRSNNGLRKLCPCPRRRWPKCAHSWHFNFKPKGGTSFRFAVDAEAGKHIEAKGDAEALAEGWRAAIRAGTFRRRGEAPVAAETPTRDAISLHRFIERYVERCEPPVSQNDRGCLKKFAAFDVDGRPLGEHPFDGVTEDTVEVFFASLRRAGRAASTRNKFVQAIKAAFRWATKKGYLARNPIADADGLKREKPRKRDRRLVPDVVDDNGKIVHEGEERRLLAVSGPRLRLMIIGAIETCCRRGELRALRWRDVDLVKRELVVRAVEKGARKTGVARHLPISTRLAGELEMKRTALEMTLRSGPAKRLSDRDVAAMLGECYVFGDEVGETLGDFKRAWRTAVLKAHGLVPQWTKSGKGLAPESLAALKLTNLKFHDLRHEGGSRLAERGWQPHEVQAMLGHANVSQTSTYLNVTRLGLHAVMRRNDDADPRCKPVASATQTDPSRDCNDAPTDDTQTVVN